MEDVGLCDACSTEAGGVGGIADLEHAPADVELMLFEERLDVVTVDRSAPAVAEVGCDGRRASEVAPLHRAGRRSERLALEPPPAASHLHWEVSAGELSHPGHRAELGPDTSSATTTGVC